MLSERMMSYSEPARYASSDFAQVEITEVPSTVGPNRWFGESESFGISIKNLAASEFVDVSSARLEFSVVVIGDIPVPGSIPAPATQTQALPMSSAADCGLVFPGCVLPACPFFESVNVKVPALALGSYLQSDQESQHLVAKRMMCSGYGASIVREQGIAGYRINGKPYLAGMSEASVRSLPVWCRAFPTDRRADAETTAPFDELRAQGSVLHYSVPMSLFSTLFDSPSAFLPLSLLSSGGDLLNVQFKVSPTSSAVNQISVDRPDLAAVFKHYIIDPRISYTKVSVLNPAIMESILSLYNGQAKLTIAPGVDVSAAMVYKTLNISASTSVDVIGAQGNFSLSLPLGHPSVRGVMLTFDAVDYQNMGLTTATGVRDYTLPGTVGTRHASRYAMSLKPLLNNLRARVGTMLIPLEGLSDATFQDGQYPVTGGNPFPAAYDAAGRVRPFQLKSAERSAARLYSRAKHLFSPYAADEDFSEDALAPLTHVQYSRDDSNDLRFFHGSQFEGLAPATAITGAQMRPVSGTAERNRVIRGGLLGPNIYLLPLESLSAPVNQMEDGYALRSLDLRNLSQMSIQGRIDGVCQSLPTTAAPGTRGEVSTSGWRIRAFLCTDSIMTILRGRTDIASEFSLIPV